MIAVQVDRDEERETLEALEADREAEARQDYDASEAEASTLWGVGMSHW